MHTKLVLIFILLVMLIAGCIFAYVRLTGGRTPGPPTPGPSPPGPACNYTLVTSWPVADPCLPEFFSMMSQGGDIGVDETGAFHGGGAARPGLTSKQDLQKYPLTFSCGHPYYDKTKFGLLSGGSWSSFVRQFTPVTVQAQSSGVLLVEGPGDPVYLNSSVDLLGIVVRRGGILLVDDVDLTIRLSYLLVESGGLFQAGSHHNDAYRFNSRLSIAMTSPEKDLHLASEYSAEIYFPGHYLQGFPKDTTKQSSSYMGLNLENTGCFFGNVFGSKVVGVGFNGNYQLNGAVSDPVPYAGTWECHTSSGQPWTAITPLTMGEGSTLPGSYPLCWARLTGASDTTITLDPQDAPANLLNAWLRPGDKIVITTSTPAYTTATQTVGLPLIWIDADDENNKAANVAANSNFKSQLGDGCIEVATVVSVDGAGAITLKSNLQATHTLGDTVLQGPKDQLHVGTRLHVGFLTRRILVTSERGTGSTKACNSTGMEPLYARQPTSPNEGDIFSTCYKEETREAGWENQFGFSPMPLGEDITGHWMMGTHGQTGCEILRGGQQMFKYGSCVSLDGVEHKYMGAAPNFGEIGLYGIHFHLSGYAKSWHGYLPPDADKSYSRELRLVNSSMWCMYNRFVTIHGSMEVEIRNNVGFLTYGSGVFVEDGTELRNDIDHNLFATCLTCVQNDYWNPTPIYPNTSSDVAVASVIWLKNNQNALTRNVCCCCPMPMTAVWYLPLITSTLRGLSTVCIGREDLELPSIASRGNAVGNGHEQGLNEFGINNANGALADFGGQKACWVPKDWTFPLADSQGTGCNAFTTDGGAAPYAMNSENVAYCVCSFHSEFPEAIKELPTNKSSRGGIIGCDNWQCQLGAQTPIWLPTNGLNACSDSYATGQYALSRWGADFQNKPIDAQTLDDLNAACNTVVNPDKLDVPPTESESNVRAIPKFFANVLLFNNRYCDNGLWWGAGWTKSSPSHLINCCLLSLGRSTGSQPSAHTSTSWMSGYNFPTYVPSLWIVYHNLITNGSIATLGFPTLFSGEGTFVDVKTVYGPSGNEGFCNDKVSGQHTVLNYYFASLRLPLFDVFSPDVWFKNAQLANLMCTRDPSVSSNTNPFTFINDLNLIDLDNNQLTVVDLVGKRGIAGAFAAPIDVTFPPQTRKFPYFCGDTSDSYGLFMQSGRAVVSVVVGSLFDSTQGKAIGDSICKNLSRMVGRLGPNPLQATTYSNAGAPPGCNVCTTLTSIAPAATGSILTVSPAALPKPKPAVPPSFHSSPTAPPSFHSSPTAPPSFHGSPTAPPSFHGSPTAPPSFHGSPTAPPSFRGSPTAPPSFHGSPTTHSPSFIHRSTTRK